MDNIDKKYNDAVKYKGEVEVGIVRNGVKYKKYSTNTGTVDLFKYLTGCLSGLVNPNYNINIRPGKLRVIGTDNKYVLAYGIPFEDVSTNYIDSDAPSASVVYTFLLPGTLVQKQKLKTVQLMSIDDKIVYAQSDFGTIISVEDIDTNVYVSWTLRIQNA